VDNEEYLQSLIRFTEGNRSLFSAGAEQQIERDKMVCRALLRCIGIQFIEEEVSKGLQEPVDISFRSASFQVTEILDRGRRRGDELRATSRKFRQTNRADDVAEPWENSLPIAFEDMAALVVSRLGEKATELGGPRGCRGIDSLVYVNLQGHHLVPSGVSGANEKLATVRAQGWRSASIVMIPYGIVWLADVDSPEFLSRARGKILHDVDRADGWFDPWTA
jgi:Putative endonuclease, protein of unknown function (DUF1780)